MAKFYSIIGDTAKVDEYTRHGNNIQVRADSSKKCNFILFSSKIYELKQYFCIIYLIEKTKVFESNFELQ